MVEEVEVTRADLVASVVKVECGVGDDNLQGSVSQQTSTKRKCPPDDEPTTAKKIAAAKERLQAIRPRSSELLGILQTKKAALAKVEKEIEKLEREKERKELERREKETAYNNSFAAFLDVAKEEEKIRIELAHLNSLTEDNARKDVKNIKRSTPNSPDDAKESTTTNALGKKASWNLW